MQEHLVRALVEEVRAGRLARRAFIERMVGLGLGVPLASSLLGAAGLAQAQIAARRTSRPSAAAAGR